ncbi:MAG: hypothetical protein ACFBSG_14680 [Leptolyngbyaceae cyanobacterium]
MNLFEIIFQYFWLLAIATGIFNTWVIRQRIQPSMQDNPALAPGYSKLLRGYGFMMIFPWIVMGIGIVFGGIPSMIYYLYPRIGNLNVWVWWGIYLLINGYISAWVLWQGGADMLITHPGFLKGNPTRTQTIKLYALLMLVGSVAVTVILFSQVPTDLPPLNNFQ